MAFRPSPQALPAKSQLIAFLEQWLEEHHDPSWTLHHAATDWPTVPDDVLASTIEVFTNMGIADSPEEARETLRAAERSDHARNVILARDGRKAIVFSHRFDFCEDDPSVVAPELRPEQRQTLDRFAQMLASWILAPKPKNKD